MLERQRLPELFVDIFYRTPLFLRTVCELLLLLLCWLPHFFLHIAVIVRMLLDLVCGFFFRGTRWRFLPCVLPLGLLGAGCPPPAGYGPSRLDCFAHFRGFSHAVSTCSTLLVKLPAARLSLSNFTTGAEQTAAGCSSSCNVSAGNERGGSLRRLKVHLSEGLPVLYFQLTSPVRKEKNKIKQSQCPVRFFFVICNYDTNTHFFSL